MRQYAVQRAREMLARSAAHASGSAAERDALPGRDPHEDVRRHQRISKPAADQAHPGDQGIRANFALFTPDGRRAILTATDGIRLIDLKSKVSRLVLAASDGTLTRIAPSSDGRSLNFLRNVTDSDIWVGTFR